MAPCLGRPEIEERWMDGCQECGAPVIDGRTCRQQWDELLALEFSDACAGSVHFLTVACHQLQHPKAFPLRAEARLRLENALGEVVVQDRPVSAIRDELRRVYDGSRPVLGPSADAAVPRHWSSTVAAVGPPDAERHVERVRSWAAAVHDDLAGNRTDAPDR